MVCLYAGQRWRVSGKTFSAIAALPVLAVQFALIAPASAHHLYHHTVSRHHAARMFADSDGFAQQVRYRQGGFEQGLYNYAPSYPDRRGRTAPETDSMIGGMAASAAGSAGVPASLVARVIKRESGGNPRAVSKGNYGLMQIRLGTARAMGYTGSAEGLLDPQTNMTYAVKYLAGAYRAAGGNEDRAVALYARGYHDVAKAQGFSPYETAQAEPRRVTYRHVADAGFGSPGFGFSAGPRSGAQNSYGFDDGASTTRLRHHRRRGV